MTEIKSLRDEFVKLQSDFMDIRTLCQDYKNFDDLVEKLKSESEEESTIDSKYFENMKEKISRVKNMPTDTVVNQSDKDIINKINEITENINIVITFIDFVYEYKVAPHPRYLGTMEQKKYDDYMSANEPKILLMMKSENFNKYFALSNGSKLQNGGSQQRYKNLYMMHKSNYISVKI